MYRAGTGNFGEFSPYTINFRGLCKSGGARAPAAPPSSAELLFFKGTYVMTVTWLCSVDLITV